LRQSPGSEDAVGDPQDSFSTFVHEVRHLEIRWSTEVYHFRFLFANRESRNRSTGATVLGRVVTVAAESALARCKRLW
jgi:hypothetical protein